MATYPENDHELNMINILYSLTQARVSATANTHTAHEVTGTYHSAGVVCTSLQMGVCLSARVCMVNMFLSLAADGATTSSLFSFSFPPVVCLCFSNPPSNLCLLIFSVFVFLLVFVLVSVSAFFFPAASPTSVSLSHFLCVCLSL